MIVDGYEVKDRIKCVCGLMAKFHHITSTHRNDKKKTIIYRCNVCRYRLFDEVVARG